MKHSRLVRSVAIFALFGLLVSLGLLNAQVLTPSPTGSWKLTGAMSQARTGAAAAAMSSGSVLVTGGTDQSGAVTASAEIYGPSGTFVVVAPMNLPRTGHTATWLPNPSGSGGLVLVTGGTTSSGAILASGELYDPIANTWTLLAAPMIDSITGEPATPLPNSSLLLSGGSNSTGVLAGVESFSLATQQFSIVGTMATARKNHAAAALQSGNVLIVGGTDGSGNTLNSTVIYNLKAGTVVAGPNLNTPRTNATATTLLDGTVLIAGGSYPEGATPANGNTAELNTAEIYDPVAGTITAAPANLVQARAGQQAFLLPNNSNVLVAGGTYNGATLASSELYTPWLSQFAATGSMSVPRSSAAGAALFPLADGQLLVAGGTNQQPNVDPTVANSAELYGFATLETNATDYSPGTAVLIAGTGWKPGELVTITLNEVPAVEPIPILTTTADANGNINDGNYAPNPLDEGVRYYATAVGATSGLQVQNTFTDSTSAVAITSTAFSVATNACSPAITVQDTCSSTFSSTTITTLSSSSGTGTFYSNSGCTTSITSEPSTSCYPNTTVTFTLYYKDTTAGSPVITATSNTHAANQTETITASGATKLAFSTSAINATAGACSGPVTVQSQNSSGTATDPSSTETIALTSTDSMTFYTASGCATSTTSVSIPTTANSASFYFKDNTAGAPTVTASGTGAFTSAPTQGETVNATTASKLAFSSSAVSVAVGGCSSGITVQSQDTYNNPSDPASTETVTLSSSDGTTTFYSGSGCTGAETAPTIPTSANSVTFYLKTTTVGGPVITATGTGAFSSAPTQTETVTGATKLAFTSSAVSVPAGDCSSGVTVTSENASSTPTAPYITETVALTSSDGTATFYSDNACTTVNASPTIATSATAVTFYFKDTTTGAPTITASGTGAYTSAPTQGETVTASASQLAFTSSPVTVAVNACSTGVTVTSQNAGGTTTAPSSTETVALSSSDGTTLFYTASGCSGGAVTSTSIPTSASAATFYFKTTTVGGPVITATGTGAFSSAPTQTETVTGATKLAFTSTAVSVPAGDCSSGVTVTSENASSTPTAPYITETVALTSSDGTATFYSDNACTTVNASPTIATSATAVTFYFKDTTTGAPTITASGTGAYTSAPTQGETVTASASQLTFTSSPVTVAVNACSTGVTVTSQNAGGTATAPSSTETVALSSSDGTTLFYTASGCSGSAVTSTSIATSANAATFYFKTTTVGSPVITATGTGAFSSAPTQTETVTGATKLAFTSSAVSAAAGACSTGVTVTSENASGTATDPYTTETVTLTSSDGTTTFYSNSTCATVNASPTISTSASAVTFYFKDSTSGTPTITATGTGAFNSAPTQVETVTPATQLVFTSTPVSVAVGACSSGITVTSENSSNAAAYPSSLETIALSSSDGTTTFYTASGCSGSAVTSTSIGTSASATTFYIKTTTVGSPVITATGTGAFSSAPTQTETVTGATKLAFTSTAVSVPAGDCSSGVTVTSENASGTATAPYITETVALTSSDGTATFYSNNTCSTVSASPTITSPATAATFYFKDTTQGTPTITASGTGAYTSAPTQIETVTASASQLAFTSSPVTVAVNACSTGVAVTSQNASGTATAPSSTETVALSSSDGTTTFYSNSSCTTVNANPTIATSASAVTFYIKTTTVGSPTITASGTGAYTSAPTQPETVTGATKLAFTSSAVSVAAGACSSGVTVTSQNASGTATDPYTTETVALTSSDGTATFYSNSTCTTVNASPTISTSASAVTFYFIDSTMGTPTITATGTGAFSNTATQGETVTVAVPTQLSIANIGNQTAGIPFPVTVTSLNASGVPTPVTTNTTVTLTLATGTGTLGGTLTGTLTSASSQLIISGVTYSYNQVGVQLKATATGGNTMTAATSAAFNVAAGPASKLQLLMPGETAAAGTASGKTGSPTAQVAGTAFTVTVNAVDANWNVILNDTDTVAITTSDPNETNPANAALVGGTKTFAVTFKTAGTQTVTAGDVTNGLITANTGTATTVSAGTASKLQLLMPGETAAPGSSAGKTGTPTAQSVGTAFNVTVNAVDANWNLATSTHTIKITSTDAGATLPANAALVGGTKAFSVTFKTAGSQTVTATDQTTPNLTANTGSATTVSATATKLAFTSSPVSVAAGSCSSGITVQSQDTNGNPSDPSSTETIVLSSNDGTAIFYSVSGCTGGAVTGTTISTSANSATFYIEDTAVGTPTITASGTGAFTSAPAQVETVGLASQTITVTTAPPPSAAYNSTFPVAATASSGLTVAITVSGGCTISSGTVTMNSPSTSCVVSFNQAGNTEYAAATQIQDTTTATPANQAALILSAATPLSYNVGETMSVTGGSTGGTVTYNLVSGSCTISGATLTANASSGSCVVTATMAGNTNYNAVTSSQVTVTLQPGNQAPAITSTANTTFTVGTPGSFTVTATGYPAPTFSETGALPSGVTLSSAGVLSGTPAAGTGGAYSITITASNGIGTDATQSFTLSVDQAPAITSAASTTFTVGTAGSFQVTATGYPAPTFTEAGALPSGVTLSSAGVLSGTPAALGTYNFTITASNGVGSNATQPFILTVSQIPSGGTASFAASTGSSGSTTLVWSQTVGSGSSPVLMVGVSLRDDSGSGGAGANTVITGITFGSQALTCLNAYDDDATGSCGNGSTSGTVFVRSEVWYLVGPNVGTANITVTTNNATVMAGGSDVYFGVNNVISGGVNASSNGQTGSSTASVGPITTAAGDLVFNNLATDSAGAPITSGNTAVTAAQDSVATGSDHILGGTSLSTAINPTMTWTIANPSPWATVAAVLTPTATGPATKLVFTSSPVSVAAGTCSSGLTVQSEDINGNISEPSSTETIALSSSDGTATFYTTSGCTGSSVTSTTISSSAYSATFYIKDAAVGTPTLTASGTGAFSSAPTQVETVSPGAVSPSVSTVVANPTSVADDGSSTATITVTLLDAYNNPVSGKTVTLTQGSGGSTITTVSGTSNSSGQASFTVKDGTAQAVTYTATDTADTVTLSQTPTVTFMAAIPTALSIFAPSPATVPYGSAGPVALSAKLYNNANGNPIVGGTVTFTMDGTIVGTAPSIAGGVATLNNYNPSALTLGGHNVAATCEPQSSSAGPLGYSTSINAGFTVGQAPQSITVTTPAPGSAAYNSQFTVAATGGASGNPILYTSSGGCSNSGATYTMTSPTTSCSVIMNQAGNTDYTAATQVTETTTATQATPTISISNIPGGAAYGGNFTPMYSYSGNGSPTYSVSSSTPGVCTVSVGVVSYVGVGTCSLQASATATTDYTAATGSAQTFTVGQATPTISISNLPSSGVYGGNFTPTYSYIGDGTTSVVSNSPSVCTVSGGLVSYVGEGTCSLTASATATTDYAAATGIAQTFAVGLAPAITSAASTTFTVGTAGSFQVTATGYPAPTFTEAGALPSGVTLSSAGVLSGTPAALGTYNFTITASNGVGSNATQPFILTVSQIPSGGTASFAASTGSSGSTTLVWSQTVGSGSNPVLMVGVSLRDDSGSGGAGANTVITGITFGSQALTCLNAYDDDATGSCGNGSTSGTVFVRSEVWYLVGPNVGTANITVTTNNATVMAGGSDVYFGVNNVISGGVNASSNGQTGSSTASVGPITTAAGDLVFNNLATDSAGAPITSGNTAVTAAQDSVTTGSYHILGGTSLSTATNPTMTWTIANPSPWATVAAVLTPTATGPATKLVFTSSPVSVAAGTCSSGLTVQSEDINGNISEPSSTETIALSSSDGTATFYTTSGCTGSSVTSTTISSSAYSATFYIKDAAVGTPTLTASGTGAFSSAPTQVETVSPGAVSPSVSTVVANPTSVADDGSSTATITVTLLDAYSNPVSGKTVTLTAGSGSSKISTASGPSSATGVVSFTVTDTVAQTVTYTAKDTTDPVTLSQTSTVSFMAAISTAVFNYAPSPATVPYGSAGPVALSAKLYNNANLNPIVGGTVTFTVDGTIVGTAPSIAGGIATLSYNPSALTLATHTIYAICEAQSGSAGPLGYSGSSPQNLVVNQGSQTITVTAPAPATAAYLSNFTIVASGGASGNPILYTSSGSCSNVGPTYTMTSPTGSCSVIMNQAGNTDYAAAPTVTETTGATPAAQSINVTTAAPATAAYNSQFTVAAAATSGLAVSYTSGGSCTNVGATYTMSSPTGNCSVIMNQAGNGNYAAAAQVTETTAETQIPQSITVNTGAPATAAYLTNFTIAANASSGLSIAYTSSGSCTNSGATYTMTSGIGNCSVIMNQVGNGSYAAAAQVNESTGATPLAQSISVTQAAPANAASNSSFTIVATATSGLAITYTSSGSCTNNGATYTMTGGSGICSVIMNQAGNSNYTAAPTVTETANVTLGTQTISVTGVPSLAQPFGTTFLVGTTGSLGTGQITITAGGACTISGNSVTISAGSGICSVTATIAADSNYGSATSTATVGATQAAAVVNWSNLTQAYSGSPEAAGVTITPSVYSFSVTYSSASYGPTTTAPTNPGVYTVTVLVSDPNYMGGDTNTLTISQLDPALSLAQEQGTPQTTPYGSTVYFELAMASTPQCPTGNVQLFVDGQASGSPVMLNGSSCSIAVQLATATMASGTHSLYASYTGDQFYQGGDTSGSPVSYTVTQDTTAVTLTSDTNTLNVGQAVTFTATVTPVTTDIAQPPSGYVQFFDSGIQIGSNVALSGATAQYTTSALAAGSHSITASFTDSDGNFVGSSTALSVSETVNLITPTIIWTPTPTEFAYGSPIVSTQVNATAVDATNGNLPVAGSFAYNFPLGTIVPAGPATMTATFTPADTNTYTSGASAATASVALTVDLASLTVTASSPSVNYGDPVPTITPSYNGFANNEDSSVLTTAPTCGTAYTTTSAAGSSPSTSCSGAAATNYSITYVSGAVTVNQVPVTVTASSTSVPYGSGTQTITPSYSSFVNGDSSSVLTTVPTCITAYTATSGVGSYPTSCSGAAAANYSFTYTPGSITVTGAPVVVTASSTSVPYGSAVPAISASYSSFQNGETSAVLTTAPACLTAYTTTSPAGTSPSTSCSGAVAANYTFSYLPGSVTVTQATQTINVTTAAPASAGFNSQFTVAASASSGLPLTYNSGGSCSNSGATYTMISGTGSCSVFLSQAGNGNFSAVAAPTETTTATLGVQSISFTPPAAQPYSLTPVPISATATSGLTVTFYGGFAANANICSLVDNGNGSATITLLGAGTCTVSAKQAGGGNWAAAPSLSPGFTVQHAAQTITFTPLNPEPAGTPQPLTATASSGLTVTFTSLTTGICTVSGTTVTGNAAGTCTIQATVAGTAQYTAATPVSQSFTVGKQSQTISFTPPAAQPYSPVPIALSATATSGLPVTFYGGFAANAGICSVTSNGDGTGSVTMLSPGTCTIQATQAGNAAYAAAPTLAPGFTVQHAAQTITFNPLTSPEPIGTPQPLTATVNSGLTITFTSLTTGICTVSGATVTGSAAGTCTVQATVAGTAQYIAATPVSQSFTVGKQSQTISFTPPANQPYSPAPIALSATATSSLPVTFYGGFASNAGICSVTSNGDGTGSVTMLNAGTCTIEAMQAGNATYAAAPSLSPGFTVQHAAQTIAFNPLITELSGTAQPLTATVSSGLAVTFTSLTTSICTVSGATVTGNAAGTCTVQATAAGNAQYTAATPVSQSFTVTQLSQTISFTPPASQAYSPAPLALSATATSGLPVTFYGGFAANAGICSVTSNGDGTGSVTMLGAGTCTIQATQAGNGTYAAAPSLSPGFTVQHAAQAITFNPLTSPELSGTAQPLTATASSGLAVSFNSLTTGICSVSGATVTGNAAGTCTVQATVAGTAQYTAATPVSQSFTVTKQSQTISFTPPAAQPYSLTPVPISATATSGLPVTFYGGFTANTGICSVTSNGDGTGSVTMLGAGTCTIEAMQAGNGTYAAAPSLSPGFTVQHAAQTITFSPLTSPEPIGTPQPLMATASSGLTVSFTSLTTGICTVSGTTVTGNAAGTCTVQATVAGTAQYTAATPVKQSFTAQ